MPDAMPKAPPGSRPGSGPRSGSAPRASSAPRSSGGAAKNKIREGLEGYTGLAAVGLAMSGDLWSSEIMGTVGPMWAETMADLAQQNAQLRKVLTALVEGGTWGAAVGTSVALVAPIIAHRASGLPDNLRSVLGMLPVTLRLYDEAAAEEWWGRYQAAQAAAENRNGSAPTT